MAEAHSAVGFQFTVTPDGVDIDFNRQERGYFRSLNSVIVVVLTKKVRFFTKFSFFIKLGTLDQAFSAVLTSSRRSWRKRLIRFLNRYVWNFDRFLFVR